MASFLSLPSKAIEVVCEFVFLEKKKKTEQKKKKKKK